MKIKSIREKLGLNELEFALLLGVNSTTIRKWEAGRSNPSAWHEGILEIIGQRKLLPDEIPMVKKFLHTTGPIFVLRKLLIFQ